MKQWPAQAHFSALFVLVAIPVKLSPDRLGPVCVQTTLNTISLQGVVLEECGGTHETDTHQKISNITRV